jgi:hypothetical protein
MAYLMHLGLINPPLNSLESINPSLELDRLANGVRGLAKNEAENSIENNVYQEVTGGANDE